MSLARKIAHCHFLLQRKLPLAAIGIISALIVIIALPNRNIIDDTKEEVRRDIVRDLERNGVSTKQQFGIQTVQDFAQSGVKNVSKSSNFRVLSKSCNKYPPKAIVIGASKCGTGALRMFLSAHPDIDNAPVKGTNSMMYAVNYFDLHYEEGLRWYIKQMPCSASDRMIIDHSPQYFRRDTQKRIYRFNSNVKLILIVREPISRTVSQYLQMKDANKSTVDTADIDSFLKDKTGEGLAVNSNAIITSTYYIHFRKWLDVFRLDQIYVMDGTEFIKNPLRQLQELETFLEVKPYFNSEIVYLNETRGFYCVKMDNKKDGFVCGSPGKGREHPKLQESTLNLLKEYFEPYNEKFFESIGKRFNWTLPSNFQNVHKSSLIP